MRVVTDLHTASMPACVATIGFFDGVHGGHRYLIDQVKAVGEAEGLPSALITFGRHPRKVMQKAYQPQLLSTPEEKIELLSQCGVDYCIVLDFTPEMASLSARAFMEGVLKEQLQVHTLVIGYDHRFGHNRSEGFDDYCAYGREIGIRIVRAKEYTLAGMDDVSSSAVRRFLQTAQVDAATLCLGYSYFLQGEVVSGHRMGRQLGFPTANLRVSHSDKLIPADGVYAAYVHAPGAVYRGMLDIGNRPSFGEAAERTIEVHLLDFSGNLYGQSIRVELVQYIRPNVRFDGIEALAAQLKHDEQAIRRVLSAK